MRRRTGAAVAGVLASVLAVAACSVEEPPAVTVTEAPEPVVVRAHPPEPVVPDPEPVVWPLTGVAVEEVAARPVLAVKIENTAAARPQIGLEHADVVWETVVEGGITRFVALYHSTLPAEVGPVRSARPQDAPIVAPYQGILAFSGAQPAFISLVEGTGTQALVMDRGHAGFRRVGGRRAPHNVAANLQTLLGQANDSRASTPPAPFAFAPEVGAGTAATAGEPAATVDIRLSAAQRTVWTWDAGSGTYLRADGARASVADTGARHAARNVVIVETQSRPSVQDRNVPETFIVGEGRAVVATGGRVVTGRWSQPGTHDVLRLVSDAGEVIELDPGSTWVHAVPTTGSWTVS